MSSLGDKATNDIQGAMIVNGPGILVLALLLTLVYIAMGLIGAALVALIAGPVIMVMTKILDWRNAPSFRTSFVAAFFGIIAFFVLLLATAFLLDAAGGYWARESRLFGTQGIPAVLSGSRDTLVFHIPFLLALALPGILGCAAVLCWRIDDTYSGVAGYVKAIFVSIVALGVSFALVALIVERFSAVRQYLNAHAAAAPSMETTLFVALGIFVFTVPAALFAGLVLYVVTRLLGARAGESYGTAYGVAFLGSLAYLSVTAIAFFLFPPPETVLQYLIGAVTSDTPFAYLQLKYELVAPALRSIAILQLPGLVAGVAVVLIRMRGSYRGALGYPMAGIAGILAFPVTLSAVLAVSARFAVWLFPTVDLSRWAL